MTWREMSETTGMNQIEMFVWWESHCSHAASDTFAVDIQNAIPLEFPISPLER